MSIEYFDEAVLPPPAPERLARFDAWLSRHYERDIVTPAAWKQQVLRWHGGAPRVRCFRAPDGNVRAICRMLNLIVLGEPGVGAPSWRKRNDDIATDFSIDYMFQCDPWADRLSSTPGLDLVPFAALDHASHDARVMTEFDLLCFDITVPGVVPIVTWAFEGSCHDPARTQRVAASFDELDGLVRGDLPDPCREPPSPAWQ